MNRRDSYWMEVQNLLFLPEEYSYAFKKFCKISWFTFDVFNPIIHSNIAN